MYGMIKKKCKKTSRFYGVAYDKVMSNGGNWIAFYYVMRNDEAYDETGRGKDRKMIARFTSEHEAAVAHDAFMLWWKMRGRLNYPRFKRPLDVEELFLYITPKEKFMSGVRPDCYACVHHKELPVNARIECRADNASVEGHPMGIQHGWFKYPFNFDPLWIQKCDSFMPKGGIPNEQDGQSREEDIQQCKKGRIGKCKTEGEECVDQGS